MEREKKPKTAIVVGAGIGGLATAARLAAAGWKVTVVEKNDFLGGRCSLINHDGYRFDQGPVVLPFLHLLRETFQDLDTSMEDEGVHFSRCNPNFIIYFHDGTRFTVSVDLSIMKKEIERFEGKYSFKRLLRCIYTLHPFESLYSRVSKYFWTDKLQKAFTISSMYMGTSPYTIPGAFSSLQYSEIAEGSWYPIGFHKIVDALVTLGKRNSVDYRLSTSVSSIEIAHSRFSKSDMATGVILENGEVLKADRIICNADVVYAYNNLLPSSPYARALANKESSFSTTSFYWALDRQFVQLPVHSFFVPEDYWNNLDTIFKKHMAPEDPTFYVCIPSRADPQAAPHGCDSIIVLVPVGHLSDTLPNLDSSGANQEWNVTVSKVRDTVLRTIHARLNVSLGPHIVKEFVNTPPSWKTSFNLDRGAVVCLTHTLSNILSFRPKTKHADICGLYFVGSSTHPGAGLPVALAGAKIVSEQLLGEALYMQWVPILSWCCWVIAALIVPVILILGAVLGGCD